MLDYICLPFNLYHTLMRHNSSCLIGYQNVDVVTHLAVYMRVGHTDARYKALKQSCQMMSGLL